MSEGGWNIAHTTNTVPDQGNPLSNQFLVAKGAPASSWGWPTDPKTEELRLSFAKADNIGARKLVANEIQVRAYEQGSLRAARPVHRALGLAQQPAGRAEIARDAALQYRKEVSLMAKTVADEYLRRIPKAELHCHLAGTLRATTVAELAARAGLKLPRPADKLYQWPDFDGFLEVLRLAALVLRTPGDFARATYEYVEDAVRDGNLKHVEFFFNPDYFYPNGIDYPAMVDA